MAAIKTRDVVKTYGELRALDGVSLEVPEGEFFGLLGPNGAGKTTLIGVLSTMVTATSGSAEVAGFDVRRDPEAVRRRIGVVFQDPSVDEELTGAENLRFHARLYKVPRADRNVRMEELLRIVELADRQNDLVKTYSGGMRRRLELARGLLHRPQVLFLDEPTLGLDPQTRDRIWEYIRRLNREEKTTMVLTTHYMDEADSLCHRIAIIDKGRIVELGTPTELKAKIGGDVIYLNLNGATGDFQSVLSGVAGVTSIQPTLEGLQIEVLDGATAIPILLEAVARHGGKVRSINLARPSLNDVFIKFTGRAIRDESMDNADRMRLFMRGRRR